MNPLIPLIGSIVIEGLKAFSEERRTRFVDEYHEILSALSKAQNAQGNDYYDVVIDLLEEELKVFLMAYKNELEQHGKESK